MDAPVTQSQAAPPPGFLARLWRAVISGGLIGVAAAAVLGFAISHIGIAALSGVPGLVFDLIGLVVGTAVALRSSGRRAG